MKKFIKIILVLFVAICCVSCSKKRYNEKVEYYMSQPKDPELLGWWKTLSHRAFYNFKSNGRVARLEYSNEDHLILDGTDMDYWHTKIDDKNRKILCMFYLYGYGSDESCGYYIIRNDSLWKSAYIEGDKFPSEMYLFGVRCEEPDELKK